MLADSVGVNPTSRDIAIEFQASDLDVRQRLRLAVTEKIDAESLAARLPAKQTRKFDHLIDVPLLTQSLAHNALDIPDAADFIESMLKRQ